MELDKEVKVYSYFTVDIDPEKLGKILNAMQLAKQNTMPGQHMFIPIAPGIAFRYVPDNGKRILAPPAPAADQATKAVVDNQAGSGKL